jgi:hypothetical protein
VVFKQQTAIETSYIFTVGIWLPFQFVIGSPTRCLFDRMDGCSYYYSHFWFMGFPSSPFGPLARAEGLPLPVGDAAALFTVIAGIALIPISIGSCGLREVGVTAMLEFRGVPVEQALFFPSASESCFFSARSRARSCGSFTRRARIAGS